MAMTDAQAADAIRAHHSEMQTELRSRVDRLLDAVRTERPYADAHLAVFDYLEGELAASGGAALVGKQLTIGDIGVGSIFVNLFHAGFGVDPKRWPKLAAYLAALHERPSFRTVIAEEKGMLQA